MKKKTLASYLLLMVCAFAFSQNYTRPSIKGILIGKWEAILLTGFTGENGKVESFNTKSPHETSGNFHALLQQGQFFSCMMNLDSAYNKENGFHFDSIIIVFQNDTVMMKQKNCIWHKLSYEIDNKNNSVFINFRKEKYSFRVFFSGDNEEVVLGDELGPSVILKKQ